MENMKINIMKTIKMACAIILVGMGLSVESQAKPDWASRESGGMYSSDITEFKATKKKSDIESLKQGDSIAMICAKCKNVSVKAISSPDSRGHISYTRIGSEHACKGCGGKIQIRPGTKETEILHVCSVCGSDSAFCCTAKGKKTSGM